VGLRSTYTIRLIRLSLIEKRLVDFPFVLIELFFRQVLRLRRYEQKLINNRRFGKGWVSIRQLFT